MDEQLLDNEALTRPISAENPAGIDPRTDASPTSPYYTLKDVRNNARATERNALVDNEPLLSHANLWRPLIDQVPLLLVEQCKDLELTAWLIEALARNFGFKGLAEGFKVATNLIQSQWEHLFPLPDEDGMETRVAPLVGLNGYEGEGTLLMPIACIPITEHDGVQAYATWEYEQALEVERLDEDKKRQRIDAGAVSLQTINDAAKATSSAFYQQLVQDIQASIDAFEEMVQSLDTASGEPQPTSQISKRLKSCLEGVTYLAGDKLQVTTLEPDLDEQIEGEGADQAEQGTKSGFATQLHSRQQAIDSLKQIADFFKQTEPHSPMAYAIDQVVRWSDMPLPELLSELISDGDARNGYFRLTGIPTE